MLTAVPEQLFEQMLQVIAQSSLPHFQVKALENEIIARAIQVPEPEPEPPDG